MDNGSISKIIKNKREELGYSLQTVADFVGVSKQTVFKWENDYIKNMGIDKLEKLSIILNIPPLELLNKKNTNANKEEKRQLPPSNACIIDGDFIKMIPLFGSVSAGFGSLQDEYIEMIPIVLKGNPDSYVAITVNGDSMEDRIMDKSIVVVNKNCPIYNGDIGIFRVNEEVFVKQKIIKNKKTYLHSFNEYYKDIEIKENDDYVELGKVTEVITRLK